MIDWKRVVADPEGFKKALGGRGYSDSNSAEILGKILTLSTERGQVQQELNALQSERNKLSDSVGQLMKQGKKPEAEAAKLRGKEINEQMLTLQQNFEKSDARFSEVLEQIANWPHASVPIGKSAADNKVVRTIGTKREFDFKPKSNDELGEALGLIDFTRATKVSGSRFVYLRGPLAQLERALINFMLDQHRAKGYEEIVPPYLVNGQTLYGIGQLPKFREDLFKIEGHDKFLIPTSEVPLAGFFYDEILPEEKLPISFVAFSPCFRSEAGSYGKDTKGLIRQHQFHKVELVKFAKPENSLEELEKLTHDAESILQALNLPYRVVLLSTGDMGNGSQKTYDLEVWLPGSEFEDSTGGCYREISSCSDMGDYQARRSKIRYKKKDKGSTLVHTLNGSGLAVGRTLIAVMENYQRADGSIEIPLALLPYMAGLTEIRRT